jgi:hypothetical protein
MNELNFKCIFHLTKIKIYKVKVAKRRFKKSTVDYNYETDVVIIN